MSVDMTTELLETVDPDIRAERVGPGYAVYRNREGRRWVAQGTCTRDGPCREGAADDIPEGAIYPQVPWMRQCCAFSFVDLPSCQPNTF